MSPYLNPTAHLEKAESILSMDTTPLQTVCSKKLGKKVILA